MKVLLQKDGLFREDDENKEKKKIKEFEDFFLSLNMPFEIEESATFGDFIKSLNEFDDTTLDVISAMYNADVRNYLRHESLVDGKESDLAFIDVKKCYEIDNFYDVDKFHVKSSFDCRGFLKAPMIEEFDGEKKENHTVAIEFTPWKELVNVPLRFNKEAHLSKIIFKECEEKNVFSNSDLIKSDRELVSYENEFLVEENDPTFNEYLQALFFELCFFENPTVRDERLKDLISTRDEYLESRKDDENSF